VIERLAELANVAVAKNSEVVFVSAASAGRRQENDRVNQTIDRIVFIGAMRKFLSSFPGFSR
jgi:hypothetical protein